MTKPRRSSVIRREGYITRFLLFYQVVSYFNFKIFCEREIYIYLSVETNMIRFKNKIFARIILILNIILLF